MVDSNAEEVVDLGRRKSYGRGGAGNIRKSPSYAVLHVYVQLLTQVLGRQSEVPFSHKINADGTPRRRSSVFSSISAPFGTSPEGKRRFSWFGSKKDGTEEVRFADVDLTGRE